MDLKDVYERVYCVTLSRRPDRWEKFISQLDTIEWPFHKIRKFDAIDGKRTDCPSWWKQGKGAWGCYRSHMTILEQCLNDGVQSVLMLEDDAIFDPHFAEQCQLFFENIPGGPLHWDMVYLGGQNLKVRDQPPERLNQYVYQAYNVNRTHGWSVNGPMMNTVYQWLFDDVWNKKEHIDHKLGRLTESRDYTVLTPSKWLIGQMEGDSDICCKGVSEKWYNNSEDAHKQQDKIHESKFVAVIGLHRSFSSAIAMMLVKLGVHMGNELGGYENKHGGGGEAVGLAGLCESIAKFPSTKANMTVRKIMNKLKLWMYSRMREATNNDTIAGGKYPHLCFLLPHLKAILDDRLLVIHCDRPLEESVKSLQNRAGGQKDDEMRAVQEWLFKEKNQHLPDNRLDITPVDLFDHTEETVDKIIKYLGISPTDDQRASAIAHIKPEHRSITI